MLDRKQLDILRGIAYSDVGKPINRVLACSTLLKCSPDDAKQISDTLIQIVEDERTTDLVKVKALTLLDKVSKTGTSNELNAEDAERVKTELLKEYLGEEEQPGEGAGEAAQSTSVQET